MSAARPQDIAQANRLRWFLAAHLLAVLAIFETSLWVGQHFAAQPDPVPTAATTAPPQPQRLAAASPRPEGEQP
ncbi:MAG: hypothetical protein EKK52_14920 [Burkholderiales bacterium]|uniref:hypothetical protein n=1 Tax=Roseateles sp. TaxID=1971397 RepID=UPI000FAAD825|nr:MAG: hypothetical protein EKK52_14920 [Burkholderiales bacterium]